MYSVRKIAYFVHKRFLWRRALAAGRSHHLFRPAPDRSPRWSSDQRTASAQRLRSASGVAQEYGPSRRIRRRWRLPPPSACPSLILCELRENALRSRSQATRCCEPPLGSGQAYAMPSCYSTPPGATCRKDTFWVCRRSLHSSASFRVRSPIDQWLVLVGMQHAAFPFFRVLAQYKNPTDKRQ